MAVGGDVLLETGGAGSATFGDGVTLDALMQHPSTVTAHLERYHVLALRLATSSVFSRLTGPFFVGCDASRPHPYPATVRW